MPLLTVCPPYIWFLATALICSSKGMNFIRDYRIGWIGLALEFAHWFLKNQGHSISLKIERLPFVGPFFPIEITVHQTFNL